MRMLVNGAGGRIGRPVTFELSKLMQTQDHAPELVAVNEPKGMDYFLKVCNSPDPVHGRFPWKVEKESGEMLKIDGMPVRFYAEFGPSKIPFRDLGIEGVMECSGRFGDPKDKEKPYRPEDNGARVFLNHGVHRVIQTYPAESADKTIIMGVNHTDYDPEQHFVISNASCTTKSMSPLQVLIDNGVEIEGLQLVTTHAATESQRVLESIGQIRTHSTGATKVAKEVFPIKGEMKGMAYRVGSLDGSFNNMYFTATTEDELTAEFVNNLMRGSVRDPRYAGRIGVFEGKDAGTADLVGRGENGIVVTSKTEVLPLSFSPEGKNAYNVGLISGYDNEYGSAVDPVLLADYVATKS